MSSSSTATATASTSSAAAAAAPPAPLLKGYLKKLKTHRKKYFVLRAATPDTQARLEYYDNERKFLAGQPPKRAIKLVSFNINRKIDTKQKYAIALFTRHEELNIGLDNEDEFNLWFQTLQNIQKETSGDVSPTNFEHVWSVYILNRGLGCVGIIGGYRLCLTCDTLKFIKTDTDVPLFELKLFHIRSCGNLKDFFFLEVGRSSSIGAGELWMETEDPFIAQNVHSTVFHAMCTRAKDKNFRIDDEDDLSPKSRTRSSSATESSKPQVLQNSRTIFSQGDGGRGRCDSMPSSSTTANRNRTISEGNQSTFSSIGRSLFYPHQQQQQQRPNSLSHSPPQGSPMSPPSEPGSGSSYSITDEPDICCDLLLEQQQQQQQQTTSGSGRYSHSMTPEEAIVEEDYNNFDSTNLSMMSSSYSTSPTYVPMCREEGYVDMSPKGRQLNITNNININNNNNNNNNKSSPSTSMSSVTSGTPSTDIKFADYPLEKVSSYLGQHHHYHNTQQQQQQNDDSVSGGGGTRPIRAYSVGSRPETYRYNIKQQNTIDFPSTIAQQQQQLQQQHDLRTRAFSCGSKTKRIPNHRVLPPSLIHNTIQQHYNNSNNNNNNNNNNVKSSSAPILSFNHRNHQNNGSHSSIGPMDDLMEMDFSRSNSSGYVDMNPNQFQLHNNIQQQQQQQQQNDNSKDGYVEMKPGNHITNDVLCAEDGITSSYVDMKAGIGTIMKTNSPIKLKNTNNDNDDKKILIHEVEGDYMIMDLHKTNQQEQQQQQQQQLLNQQNKYQQQQIQNNLNKNDNNCAEFLGSKTNFIKKTRTNYFDMTNNTMINSSPSSSSSLQNGDDHNDLLLSSSPQTILSTQMKYSPKEDGYVDMQCGSPRVVPDGYVDMNIGCGGIANGIGGGGGGGSVKQKQQQCNQRQSSLSDYSPINDYANMTLNKNNNHNNKSTNNKKNKTQPINIQKLTNGNQYPYNHHPPSSSQIQHHQQQQQQQQKSSSSNSPIFQFFGRKFSSGTPPKMTLPLQNYSTSSLPRNSNSNNSNYNNCSNNKETNTKLLSRKNSTTSMKDSPNNSSSSITTTPSSSSTIFPMSLNSPCSPVKPLINNNNDNNSNKMPSLSSTLSPSATPTTTTTTTKTESVIKVPSTVLQQTYKPSTTKLNNNKTDNNDYTCMEFATPTKLNRNTNGNQDYVNFQYNNCNNKTMKYQNNGRLINNKIQDDDDYAVMKPGGLEPRLFPIATGRYAYGVHEPRLTTLQITSTSITTTTTAAAAATTSKHCFRPINENRDELISSPKQLTTTTTTTNDNNLLNNSGDYEQLRSPQLLRPNSVNSDISTTSSSSHSTLIGNSGNSNNNINNSLSLSTTSSSSRPGSVNSDKIRSSSTTSEIQLHYASLDLEDSGSFKNSRTSTTTITTACTTTTTVSTTATNLNSNNSSQQPSQQQQQQQQQQDESQPTIEPTLTYAAIDFIKSEGLKQQNNNGKLKN